MKLRKFENFEPEQGFDAQGLNAQGSNDDQDVQSFDGEETQEEEETMGLDEVVDKILAAVEEHKDDNDEEEVEEGEEGEDLRSKITAILNDFHNDEEKEEDFEGDDYSDDNENDLGFASHDGGFGGDDSENEMPKFEGLKKFKKFK